MFGNYHSFFSFFVCFCSATKIIKTYLCESEGTPARRDITVLLPFCSTKKRKKKSVFDRNTV